MHRSERITRAAHARGMPILLTIVLVTLWSACATTPGKLVLRDETSALDPAQVAAAAAPLLARGAIVAIVVVERGDDTGEDLTRILAAEGLLANSQVIPEALVMYVSYEPHYSELRAGTRWSARLPDAALREIRTSVLNPALRADRLGAGVADTLATAENRLANPPLLERIGTWATGVVLAGLALFAFVLSPAGARLGHWWRRSPPGRLARWLVV